MKINEGRESTSPLLTNQYTKYTSPEEESPNEDGSLDPTSSASSSIAYTPDEDYEEELEVEIKSPLIPRATVLSKDLKVALPPHLVRGRADSDGSNNSISLNLVLTVVDGQNGPELQVAGDDDKKETNGQVELSQVKVNPLTESELDDEKEKCRPRFNSSQSGQMSYQESENDDGEYEKFSDNESNAEGFLSTLKVDESNADTSSLNFSSVAKLKTMANKWKEKAIKSGRNQSFAPIQELPYLCHSLYHTKRKVIPLKNYHDETRAMKDLSKFLEKPVVLFNVHAPSWEEIVKEMLLTLKAEKPELKFNVEKLAKTVTDRDADYVIPETIQGVVRGANHQETNHTEQSFVTVLGAAPSFADNQIVMCVLDKPYNFGPKAEEVRFICMILSPTKNKLTKSGIEVGRTYSTLLADEHLRMNLLKVHTPQDFAHQFEIEVHRIHKEHERHERMKKIVSASEVADIKAKSSESGEHACMRFIPGKDLWDDIKRRAPHYLSDFTEGTTDSTSIQKMISATLFLYFSLLLPGLAFGILNWEYTNHHIDAKKVLISQALGGLLFSLFGGQPLVIIRTTIPVTIYTKVIYIISTQFVIEGKNALDGDFFGTFYAMCGFFNAMFIIIYSITGVSKIMLYCSRSTEEIVGLFISIAFTVDSIKYLVKQFKIGYNFDCAVAAVNASNHSISKRAATEIIPVCNPIVPMLALLLVLGTVYIGVMIYNFKNSPYLNAAKRVLVADYALVVAVLVMSVVGSYLFKDIEQEKFKIQDEPIFSMNEWLSPTVGSVIASIGLGFIMSILFFMEGNISASIVNNPRNRLKKGPAFHLDMFVTGLINALMSIFGLPWIHGSLPHSPLHVRALADIEETIDNGHLTEKIVYVRETRLTTLVSHIMIGASIYMVPFPLELIPIPVLYGLLLFLAITSLEEFQMWERFVLIFTEQNLYPPIHYIRKVPQKIVHSFTLLQLVQLGVLCVISFAGSAYLKMLFPFVIIMLMPIRAKIMPQLIPKRYLEALDGTH